ncbi:alpha/beta fold hydrolase [Paracraurococcus lichenis]|uniref:Alpha/beta fold hydrolase n=1 Tax=Paracraurococcus lichenis TaxID=3064888 RepID=A0ABT9E4K8_9PROT|nr:alpha/beta fold hydrolase [Paracraurococcus sp. LOR1-02]MDO9711093.1 alpha/beta fold hydrolase [Paracraurococcus sp. LOR1-02]
MTAALLLLLAALGGAGWYLYDPDRPRAALEARWAPPPSQFVDVLGVRLHIRDTGPREGPAVLLIHGFAASLHTWEAWAPLLEDRFRLIRLDLPGFGLTGPDPGGDYTDERSAVLLAALLDRLGVARAAVVGSSMGGRIAWRFAVAAPARVAKLVLMAPDGFASPGRDYDTVPRVPALMRLLPWTLPRPLLKHATAGAYAVPGVLTAAVVDRYRDMLLAPGVRQAILDRLPQTVLRRPEPMLATLRMPVLLLWGEEDRAVPVAHAADYLRVLPDARAVVLPGIGHVPMEEAPAASAAALRQFLEA